MTYEQQFQAMQGLDTYPTLRMRRPGDWYVSLPSVEIGGNGMLRGVGESGRTPQEAIEKTWQQLITVEHPKCLVIHATSNNRRELSWNGFMWSEVP